MRKDYTHHLQTKIFFFQTIWGRKIPPVTQPDAFARDTI
jgi:hypothetical protein